MEMAGTVEAALAIAVLRRETFLSRTRLAADSLEETTLCNPAGILGWTLETKENAQSIEEHG